jgi:hypothetical protein
MDQRPGEVPLRRIDPSTIRGVRRRDALQALAGGIGASLALPSLVGAQHPMHQHLGNAEVLGRAQQNAAVAAYTPEFLDAHALQTLESLAEAIVPGSTNARVAPFLDQLLAVESTAVQRAFLGSLGAFDMAAIGAYGQAWTTIGAANQDVLLRDASTADASASPMRGHFQNLKDWIAGAYYSSEPGMRELGWDGTVVHGALPACTHPDGHEA